ERRDLLVADLRDRIGYQAGMELTLCRAGLLRRHHLGARQIGLEELRRDRQAAGSVAIEQLIARGHPEVGHEPPPRCRSRSLAIATMSTVSPGSSSPSASSTMAKARARPWSRLECGDGFSVRKRSRISPSTKARCRATIVPSGCSASEAANAISSSAAARAEATSGAPCLAAR